MHNTAYCKKSVCVCVQNSPLFSVLGTHHTRKNTNGSYKTHAYAFYRFFFFHLKYRFI